MKILKMSVIHRILVKGLLDEASKKGSSLSDLSQMIKIVDKINFTEDEAKELKFETKFVDDKDPSKGASIHWNKEIDTEKDFELSDDQAQMVKDIIKKKNDAKEFTSSEYKVADVAEQLEIKL